LPPDAGVESGGVRLLRNMSQLVTEATTYVPERARDAEARRALVSSEHGTVHGRSTERFAHLIALLCGADTRGEPVKSMRRSAEAGESR
jgi:hypothetical protein